MSTFESEWTPRPLFRVVPPPEEIEAAFRDVTLEVAQQICAILKGEADPRSVQRTDAWCRKCYHEPPQRDQAEHAVDVLLDTHGVEAFARRANDYTRFTYANAGETYATTLLFFGCWPNADRVEIGCWGDVVESLERDGVQWLE